MCSLFCYKANLIDFTENGVITSENGAKRCESRVQFGQQFDRTILGSRFCPVWTQFDPQFGRTILDLGISTELQSEPCTGCSNPQFSRTILSLGSLTKQQSEPCTVCSNSPCFAPFHLNFVSFFSKIIFMILHTISSSF